ncbi:MAG TPA: peptidase S15, partial [Candidatus Polarisedimenticolia bacterium]|nr:peptidase S15 [Candidatus Polarisedimenticolia bacterium]
LALSTCYWPIAWPAPEPVTLTLHTGGSRLSLPVRPVDPADERLPPFPPPESAGRTTSLTPLKPPRFVRSIERDLTTNRFVYRLFSEGGDLELAAISRIEEIDLDLGHTVERLFSIDENDPLSARTEISEQLLMRRGSWTIRVHARTELTADRHHFRLRASLRAMEGKVEMFKREWDERVTRPTGGSPRR